MSEQTVAATETAQAAKPKVVRNYGPKETVPISIPDVLAMLNKGMTRKEIGAHYGLNQPQTAALFENPKLKGKKTKKQASNAFEIVDEGGDDIPVYDPATRKLVKPGSNGSTEGSVATAPATPAEAPAAPVASGWDS